MALSPFTTPVLRYFLIEHAFAKYYKSRLDESNTNSKLESVNAVFFPVLYLSNYSARNGFFFLLLLLLYTIPLAIRSAAIILLRCCYYDAYTLLRFLFFIIIIKFIIVFFFHQRPVLNSVEQIHFYIIINPV